MWMMLIRNTGVLSVDVSVTVLRFVCLAFRHQLAELFSIGRFRMSLGAGEPGLASVGTMGYLLGVWREFEAPGRPEFVSIP